MSASPSSARNETKKPAAVRYLLWIDSSGALAVGALMLLVSDWLQGFFRFPSTLYYVIASANLGYGCFALVLALLRKRPLGLLVTLAAANALWGCVCLVLAAVMFRTVSVWGLMHILAEGAVVFSLARAEWKHRASLTTA
jgi:hypothetical protein